MCTRLFPLVGKCDVTVARDSLVGSKKSSFLLVYIAGVFLHLAYLMFLVYLAPMDQWNWQIGVTGSYLRPAESLKDIF
jgi:hypothetical protein